MLDGAPLRELTMKDRLHSANVVWCHWQWQPTSHKPGVWMRRAICLPKQINLGWTYTLGRACRPLDGGRSDEGGGVEGQEVSYGGPLLNCHAVSPLRHGLAFFAFWWIPVLAGVVNQNPTEKG